MESKLNKVVVVGDSGVGKTSILHKYVHGTLSDHHQTVGANSVSIQIEESGETEVFSVWDTAGQEQFHSFIPFYARHASIALVVYDQTSIESFRSVDYWYQLLKSSLEVQDIILVGNKNDLPPQVSIANAVTYAENANIEFFRTSALTGDGIQMLFIKIGQIIQQKRSSIEPVTEINFTWDKNPETNKKNCC